VSVRYTHLLLEALELDGELDVGVPAIEAWVVRDVEVVQGAAAVASEFFLLSGSIPVVYKLFDHGGYEHFQWQGRVCIEPSGLLRVQTGGPMSVYVTGYKLTA
jgi:hypothetical protein